MFDASQPLLLGHRGAPWRAHENSLDAFRAALEAGLDGVECDLQLTQDGVLAVHHDATLRDTPVAGMTWASARRRAPWLCRLEELFELLEAYPEAYLNIELKSTFPKTDGREAALAQTLAGWSGAARQRTWISCFDPTALLRLAKFDLSVPLALLAAHEEVLELLPCLPVTGLHLKHTLLSTGRVREQQAQGRAVFAWTVNDEHRARELLGWGVNGLIGDDPDTLLRARGSAG